MPKKATATAARKKNHDRAKKLRARERRNVDACGQLRAKRQRERERKQRMRARASGPRHEEAIDENFDGNPNEIDIRVGAVLTATEHPNADSLLVETIDVGDHSTGPRTICSGLRGKIEPSELEGSRVLVMCNLRKRNMRGVDSNGMVLVGHRHDPDGATDEDGEPVEIVSLLEIGEDCYVGERIMFEGCEERPVGNSVRKSRLAKFLPFFKSGDDRICAWRDFKMKGQYTGGRILTSTPNESVS